MLKYDNNGITSGEEKLHGVSPMISHPSLYVFRFLAYFPNGMDLWLLPLRVYIGRSTNHILDSILGCTRSSTPEVQGGLEDNVAPWFWALEFIQNRQDIE